MTLAQRMEFRAIAEEALVAVDELDIGDAGKIEGLRIIIQELESWQDQIMRAEEYDEDMLF